MTIPSDNIKILVIGDPHFKVDNVTESREMISSLEKLAIELQPNLIICLGDILDRHEKIHVNPLTEATNFLSSLVDIAPTVAIIGNHDRPNNSDFLTNRHPFNALKRWKNMTVVDKVVEMHIKDYRFVFVPYVPPGRFQEALNTIDDPIRKTDVIFSHQEFFGAQMGAVKSTVGDKWPVYNPLVISGHIHDYSHLQDNLIYVGTPTQHAFGDRDDKTVSLFSFWRDPESPGLSGNSRRLRWSEERHDLKLTKRKIVRLKPSEILSWKPSGNFLIKVVIKGTTSEIKATMKLAYIKELTEQGIKVVYKTIPDCPNVLLKTVDQDGAEISNDNIENKRMTYLERFGLRLEKDPALNMIFERMFGSLKSGSHPENQSAIQLLINQ